MSITLLGGLWWKNMTTLFPETLKVKKNKVVLFLWLKAPKQSYGRFYVRKMDMSFSHTKKKYIFFKFLFYWSNM